MPEPRTLLCKAACCKCRVLAWHERGTWFRKSSGRWYETLTCRVCKKSWDRKALPFRQKRLDEAYPDGITHEKRTPKRATPPIEHQGIFDFDAAMEKG